MRYLFFITISLFLAACGSTPTTERYQIDSDIAPDTPISVHHLEDAQPRYEAYSLAGNKDYTLRGIDYTIVEEPKGFTQEGIASWYGEKFHGHKTSNGEVYDMYSMSAAHKTLPLPSFVKVTNKDNGKTAIVRINDRGPFHTGRIIDLSFSAAKKLDVIKTGTANVKIEVITTEKPSDPNEWYSANPNLYFIQMAAVKNSDTARTLSQTLSQKFSAPTDIKAANSVLRVRLGPFIDRDVAMELLNKVKASQYRSAFISQEKRQLPDK